MNPVIKPIMGGSRQGDDEAVSAKLGQEDERRSYREAVEAFCAKHGGDWNAEMIEELLMLMAKREEQHPQKKKSSRQTTSATRKRDYVDKITDLLKREKEYEDLDEKALDLVVLLKKSQDKGSPDSPDSPDFIPQAEL